MAVVVRDVASGGIQQTATTVTVSLTGLDVIPGALLMVFCSSERGALVDIKTPTCSDGVFTQVDSGVSGASGLFLKTFIRQITTTTSTNFTVTTTNTTAGSVQKTVYGGALVFTNHNGVGNTGSSTDSDAPSVTANNANDMLVICTAYEDPQSTTPTPAGMTAQFTATDASNLGQMRAWTQSLTSSGATGTRGTQGNTTSRANHVLIVSDLVTVTPGRFFPFFGG